MAQLWTLSGINSFRADRGKYVDYVAEHLDGKLSKKPNRSYASRLGTGSHYTGAKNVKNLKSEAILDQEAVDFTTGAGPYAPIQPRLFRGKEVRCLLVAPKTTTPPPVMDGLVVEIYWNPMDHVPNQDIFSPDSKRSWKPYLRGGGRFWAIQNLLGSGFGKGHPFEGFMVQAPKTMKYITLPKPGAGSGKRRTWRVQSKRAPNAVATLNGWLADPSVDHVLVAHSQGTNIAMHILSHGC